MMSAHFPTCKVPRFLEVRQPGGHGAHLVVGLLQGHDLAVPDPEHEPVNGPCASGGKPGVGAAIGDGDVAVGVLETPGGLFNYVFTSQSRQGENCLQVLVQGQVQEGVDGVLAGHLGDFADGPALELNVALVFRFQHLDDAPGGAEVGGFLHVFLHGLAGLGDAKLGGSFLRGADEGLDPVGHVIVEVVLGELEFAVERRADQAV